MGFAMTETVSATLLQGTAAITDTFARAGTEGRATFMPYWMIGYPDLPTSIMIVQILIDAGADVIECGVPFSDPVADGVVVQAAGKTALEQGVNLHDCVEAVRQLRAANPNSHVPLVLMSYFNPMLSYGLDRYVTDVANIGADGFIVPDLPPEEARDLLTLCDAQHLALIGLLAPTSSAERITRVSATSRGFIYLVSVTGVTGARQALSGDLGAFIDRVRAVTDLPLSVGFGISDAEQARQVGQVANGFIVGSALIRAYANATDEISGIDAVRTLAISLRGAC